MFPPIVKDFHILAGTDFLQAYKATRWRDGVLFARPAASIQSRHCCRGKHDAGPRARRDCYAEVTTRTIANSVRVRTEQMQASS